MFDKFLQFIKYNNATFVIVLVFFVLGTSVFASETGREVLGQKNTRVEGTDNTALLEADLDNMDMDFRIEDVGEDEKYYYVVYTHIDLVKENSIWQYQVQEKTKKISKKSGVDLSSYLVEEMKEEYEDRIKYLREQKEKSQDIGLENKVEISEYSGLVGRVLSVADNIFEGYEAVKVKKLPVPAGSDVLRELKTKDDNSTEGVSDNLAQVYNNYIKEHDADDDEVLDVEDNCPNDYNPSQGDRDFDGIGDVCDANLEEEIIEDDLSEDDTSNEDLMIEEPTEADSSEVIEDGEEETISDTIPDEEPQAEEEEEIVTTKDSQPEEAEQTVEIIDIENIN